MASNSTSHQMLTMRYFLYDQTACQF